MKSLLIILLVTILTSVSVLANENDNKKFLDRTIGKFFENCKGKTGVDYLNCWADNSPKKCKSLVYAKDRRAWKICVYSCGSEGFYSRTIGECSN